MARPRPIARAACGWTLALTLVAATGAVPAQGQTAAERQTAQTVRAVAAEARQRRARNAPVTEGWRTLDRALLERLLSGPDLATYAGRQEVNLLIDQAGAWDLLHFDKPSDVLASWQRWRPDDASLRPVVANARPDLTGDGFYADAPYGDESGAFMALWRCLARPAWRVFHMEPMIWALEQGTGWDVPNSFDFGRCVLAQSEDGESPFADAPDTERGKRSAAVLERKLSATLRRDGCSGNGPDSCLVLAQALTSLAPRHAELPRILASMAPHFQSRPGPMPSVANAGRSTYGTPVWDAAQQLRRALVREGLFLEVTVAVLRHQLTAAPPDEPGRSLQRLLELTGDLARLDAVQGTANPRPHLSDQGSIGNPWSVVVQAAADPAWSQALQAVGATAAGAPGCDLTDRLGYGFRNTLPAPVWLGYAAHKLVQRGDSCHALALSSLAALYQDAQTSPEPLERLQVLRGIVGDESRARAHNELIAALAPACPRAQDPWRVCDWAQAPPWHQRGDIGLTRLPLRPGDRFTARPLGADADNPSQPFGRLLDKVRSWRPRAYAAVTARLSELQRIGPAAAVSLWTHPRHALAAALLHVSPATAATGDPARMPTGLGRTGQVLLIFGHTQAWLVNLPGGWGQYDDGSLAALSDIDGDGRLEVWFSGEHGECDGEDSKPGVDCARTVFGFGGEVFGDELSAFIRGHPPKQRP